MSLTATRAEFLRGKETFAFTLGWINTKGPGGGYVYDERIRDFVIESAFLKLFIAWETFLEGCFLLFLLGQQPRTGVPVTSLARPNGLEHARGMLIGTQRYVDWANPDIVVRLADLYLRDGFPVSNVIGSIKATLLDMKTVRNASAHLSSTTRRAMDVLTQRELATTFPVSPVSRFLLHPHPAKANAPVIETYLQELDAATKLVVEPEP